jgi:hypothetical protein
MLRTKTRVPLAEVYGKPAKEKRDRCPMPSVKKRAPTAKILEPVTKLMTNPSLDMGDSWTEPSTGTALEHTRTRKVRLKMRGVTSMIRKKLPNLARPQRCLKA